MAKKISISIINSVGANSKGLIGIHQLNRQNMVYWNEKIDQALYHEPDLIVLPEVSDKFQDHSIKDYVGYITSGGGIFPLLSEIAKNNNVNIVYPCVRVVEEGSDFPYRNSSVFIDRNGNVSYVYDKNYVMVEEKRLGVAYSDVAQTYIHENINMAFGLCFDLNFDDLLKKYKEQEPELFIFSSMYHGGLKQDFWAYNLRTYMVSAIKGNTSRILDPFGRAIAHTSNYSDFAHGEINVDCAIVHLDHNWTKIKEAQRKYKKGLEVYDPGNFGTVLMTAESDDFSIDDVLNEFEIIDYDSYLSQSSLHRQMFLENRGKDL